MLLSGWVWGVESRVDSARPLQHFWMQKSAMRAALIGWSCMHPMHSLEPFPECSPLRMLSLTKLPLLSESAVLLAGFSPSLPPSLCMFLFLSLPPSSAYTPYFLSVSSSSPLSTATHSPSPDALCSPLSVGSLLPSEILACPGPWAHTCSSPGGLSPQPPPAPRPALACWSPKGLPSISRFHQHPVSY